MRDGALLGARRNDVLGDSFADVGDVDGDGITDLLVGHRKGGIDEAGAAHLFLTLPDVGTIDDADVIWTGTRADDWAGERVAAAGDLDGDGYADLLVGAPRARGEAPEPRASTGEAYVVHGGPALAGGPLDDARAVIRGDRVFDAAGRSLVGAQDLDGDGVPDVALGTGGDDVVGWGSGRVAVFFGPVEGRLRVADADGWWRGAHPEAGLGAFVAGVGDLDGDGADDLMGSVIDPVDGPSPERQSWLVPLLGGPGW